MKGMNLSRLFKNFSWICTLLVFIIPELSSAIQLNLGSASGTPGSDVTIPIILDYQGSSPNICATSNDIGFDTNVLENSVAVIGPAWSAAGKNVYFNVVNPGSLRVGVLGFNQNIIQGGIVACVTFKIKPTATLGNKILTNSPSATDPNGNSVSVQGSSGVVNIILGEKWSGTASISVKVTSLFEDAAGNIKFANDNDIISGTLEILLGEEDLVPNEDGCYIYFISDDKRDSCCVTQKASISTNYVKPTTSDTAYLKGIGTLHTTWEGEPIEGLFFLDITKATFKKDKTGDLVSIIISGKFGGGFDGIAVFSGTLKATLYKK